MNFLIDDSQNKLILQVFNDIEKSLNYTVKLGQKTDDQLFNQFFGTDTQTKEKQQKITKKKFNSDWFEDQYIDQYALISRPSLVKQEVKQKPINSDLLKNTKTLSNIHLRHLVQSYLKGECKKIEEISKNYSCEQVKDMTKNLILNFFLRYTLIFEELQTMAASETIEKQLKKSITSIYVEIFCLIYKKGFRSFLTLLKMTLRIWNIASFIQNDTFSVIKRQIKQLLGINIQFLLTENDKLTYELAFKLRGMPIQTNFDYKKQIKKKKQEKNQRKKEKLKKKILRQLEEQQLNKIQVKKIKIQSQIIRKQPQIQQKGHLSEKFQQNISLKLQEKNLKQILAQKIDIKYQQNTKQKQKTQAKLTVKSQNFKNNLTHIAQTDKIINSSLKGNKTISNNSFLSQNHLVTNKRGKNQETNLQDQSFVDKLRKKIKSQNSIKKDILDHIKKQ